MVLNVIINVLLVFFVIDCVLMGLVIMMQRSKQEGLGAAFGGGFTESVWGAQTSQVLVKATAWFAIIFFVLSITLARLYSHREALTEKGSMVQQELLKPVAPAVTNAAPATQATNAPAKVVHPDILSVLTNAPASAAPAPAKPAK